MERFVRLLHDAGPCSKIVQGTDRDLGKPFVSPGADLQIWGHLFSSDLEVESGGGDVEMGRWRWRWRWRTIHPAGFRERRHVRVPCLGNLEAYVSFCRVSTMSSLLSWKHGMTC